MQYKNELTNVLTEDHWITVNKTLLAKMLSEYMYEGMIKPEVATEENGWLTCRLNINESKTYVFGAKCRLFDSFYVDPESIFIHQEESTVEATSAIDFLLDIQPIIGMSSETAGHLIKELNQTLLADLHLLSNYVSSDDLIDLDYALLEGYMTGHPWITYNKGRIGFGYDDYLSYAPEQQNELSLSWIAVHKDSSSFQSVEEKSYEQLINEVLSEEDLHRFSDMITQQNVNERDYYFMPIHEWQWKNTIIQNFPSEIAKKVIIPLGESSDRYLPQQSVRTFVNMTHKEKHHVKLPMSILNTLVYRGLPAERTLIAPTITRFIKGIYEKDDFLKNECRVILPGEIASLNVDQQHYLNLPNAPYQYLEMLGVIYRESIYTYLEEGEQAITLASLHYEDHDGKPFVKSLIEKSGLTTDEWITSFMDVTLKPLLHYLYRYGVVFSPHGQNTILVLKDYKPHRLAVKDFVDDVNISDQPFEELSTLTDDLKKVLRSEPPEGLTQFIFTGLFICHLRYMSSVLERSDLMDEETFWSKLADSIQAYQSRFPELSERFHLFDFFKPELTKLTLNRNRMVDYGYGDGDERPHASEFGKVTNALHQFVAKIQN
ncbi:IucA/IucC family siderophore biosynthesis protein [Alkalihalobacillus macyae]|uniref:IucA/IucC family protein n=1 Tax=Guptibacillus hwajinpoensis TaxID=208199 RepID=UPI00273A9F8A|nr:IucA/IucC family siderophore biosynthesis protein [Alkalihalobacillus macyae]MDP4549928.1 IucA/IucC family siderophore biosynthesis protein [Alkalihalobacillus macyae]